MDGQLSFKLATEVVVTDENSEAVEALRQRLQSTRLTIHAGPYRETAENIGVIDELDAIYQNILELDKRLWSAVLKHRGK